MVWTNCRGKDKRLEIEWGSLNVTILYLAQF